MNVARCTGRLCAGIALLAAQACAAGGGMGAALRVSDVTPEAIPALEAEHRQRPLDGGVHTRLALAYFKAERFQEARAALDSVTAREPRNGLAAVYLGMASEAVGEFAAARTAYEDFIRLAERDRLREVARERLAAVGRRELEYRARAALAQESTLAALPPEENTIAVMPFTSSGAGEELRSLERGFAQLVVTDLAKSRRLRVLERDQLQAILTEMRLSDSALVDPSTALRGGRLLRAARVVQGSLRLSRDTAAAGLGDLRVDAAVVDVATTGVAAAQGVSGPLARLFDLEKDLVFALFDNLGIELAPAEREAINRRPTQNLQAFLAYSRGLEAEDRGDFQSAEQAYQEAFRLDPGFRAAERGEADVAVLSRASARSVGEVEAAVQRALREEAAALRGAERGDRDEARRVGLRDAIDQVAPTLAAAAERRQAGDTRNDPPGARDVTAEVTRREGTGPATGTVIIVIRRPPP